MIYKWKAGDWAQHDGLFIAKVSDQDIRNGSVLTYIDERIPLARCTPVIVRPKPLPKRIKRSELRAWFERANCSASRWQAATGSHRWTLTKDSVTSNGPTLEAAILALRKALRKAGKFTP